MLCAPRKPPAFYPGVWSGILCGGSKLAVILDITAKNTPRGAFGDNIYVVNDGRFDNIFIYFYTSLTINVLSFY